MPSLQCQECPPFKTSAMSPVRTNQAARSPPRTHVGPILAAHACDAPNPSKASKLRRCDTFAAVLLIASPTPPFGGRQSIPHPCYRSSVPRSFLSLSAGNSSVDPGVLFEMFKSSPRRWALCALLFALPLTVTFVVRAAVTDPASSNPAPAPSTPDLPPAAYTANIHITGPTTQFHDSVAPRYNYAFGKDIPLPSLERDDSQRPVHQPAQCPHRRILRPLPPGGLPPVAPIRSLQQLPRTLVPEERQHAHRLKRACSTPATAKAATTPSRSSQATSHRACPRSALSRMKASPAPSATPSMSTDTTGTGSYVMGTPAVLVDEKGAPVTAPGLRRRDSCPPRPPLARP